MVQPIFATTYQDNYYYEANYVANLFGLLTQTTVLNKNFENLDYYQIKKHKTSKDNEITKDILFEREHGIYSGLWIRPFVVQNDLKIGQSDQFFQNGLSNISGLLVGTLAGIDFKIQKNWLLSFYLGYVKSSQRLDVSNFQNVFVCENGYILGTTGLFVKDNWYAGVTTNIIFTKAHTENLPETDKFDMNMYSIGAKTGYNFHLNKSFILEPNLMFMLGRVKENVTFFIEPQIKAKLNLAKGWQPYGLLGYSLNNMNGSMKIYDTNHIINRNILYFTSGVGVNKRFSKTLSTYFNVICKFGEMEGISVNLGIKYNFISLEEKTKEKIEKEQLKKQKALEKEKLKIEKKRLRKQKVLEKEKLKIEKEKKEKQRLLEIEKKLQENYD
jgi:hypothetical protein